MRTQWHVHPRWNAKARTLTRHSCQLVVVEHEGPERHHSRDSQQPLQAVVTQIKDLLCSTWRDYSVRSSNFELE